MSVMFCPSRVPLPWKDTSTRTCCCVPEGVMTLVPVILPDASPIWSPNAMGALSFLTASLDGVPLSTNAHNASKRSPVRTSENSSSTKSVNSALTLSRRGASEHVIMRTTEEGA